MKQHYTRLHGFSCAEHSGFREFVGFVERLGQGKLEGHFREQTSVCDLRYPFTDLVLVAEGELDTSLNRLGSRLGCSGTVPSIRSHRTGSNKKLADMFREDATKTCFIGCSGCLRRIASYCPHCATWTT